MKITSDFFRSSKIDDELDAAFAERDAPLPVDFDLPERTVEPGLLGALDAAEDEGERRLVGLFRREDDGRRREAVARLTQDIIDYEAAFAAPEAVDDDAAEPQRAEPAWFKQSRDKLPKPELEAMHAYLQAERDQELEGADDPEGVRRKWADREAEIIPGYKSLAAEAVKAKRAADAVAEGERRRLEHEVREHQRRAAEADKSMLERESAYRAANPQHADARHFIMDLAFRAMQDKGYTAEQRSSWLGAFEAGLVAASQHDGRCPSEIVTAEAVALGFGKPKLQPLPQPLAMRQKLNALTNWTPKR